jgi:bacteriocin-like protein
MNHEITTQIATVALAELSEQELDNVSGGLSLNGVHKFASGGGNSFRKKTSLIEQGTFAGEHGSGTMSSVGIEDIFSSAGQGMVIG